MAESVGLAKNGAMFIVSGLAVAAMPLSAWRYTGQCCAVGFCHYKDADCLQRLRVKKILPEAAVWGSYTDGRFLSR